MTLSLAALEVDVDALQPAELEALYPRVEALAARLRVRLFSRSAAPEPDRILSLDEAAARLGTSRSWLERRANWRRVGGYKDQDRHVKFARSALEAYLHQQLKAP